MVYAPPLLVAGPPRTALPFGLFSALAFATPADPHWQNGIEWEPVAGCLDVLGATDPGCFGSQSEIGYPVDFDDSDTGGLNGAPATPFTVYGRYPNEQDNPRVGCHHRSRHFHGRAGPGQRNPRRDPVSLAGRAVRL
jgi:hypothetical protein